MVVVIPHTQQNASINRVRIVDLPGITVDEVVIGEQAYNLLSAPAIVSYTLAHADALDLPFRYRTGNVNRIELRRDLPRFLDSCLTSPQQVVRETAYAISRQLGRNLGFLLLTLHRGDKVNRDARSDWSPREWDQWHTIRQVYIGGGIVSGRLGDHVIENARQIISFNGYGEVIRVKKGTHPRMMAAIGATRYFPQETKQALCLDLGQTSVKSIVTHFESDIVTHVTQLPTHDVKWNWRNDPNAKNDIDPHDVVQFVTNELMDNWMTVVNKKIRLDRDIMICIAAYVQRGRLFGNGIYAQMNILAEDVRIYLSRKLREQAGIDSNIHIIHDGTAAAAVHAGEKNSAVLVLGTAIGVGFVPESANQLRGLSPGLEYKKLQ
jgi:hypothetical protein